MKNHELTLPDGYREVYRINALDKKVGLILNLVAAAIMTLIIFAAMIPLSLRGGISEPDPVMIMISCGAFLVSLIAYMVLHELVHGIAYKALTHERLTFGLGWSCAYCGVPNIYVYRKAALIALVSPLIAFTLILLPLAVIMLFINPYAYLVSVCLLGLHLGGCAGDGYITLLLLRKFKSDTILMRDTGPEQFFYERSCESEKG